MKKKLISMYLNASYKYYVLAEETGLSDMEFDYICQELYESYESLTDADKALVSKDSLRAGTGCDIPMSTYLQAGVL